MLPFLTFDRLSGNTSHALGAGHLLPVLARAVGGGGGGGGGGHFGKA